MTPPHGALPSGSSGYCQGLKPLPSTSSLVTLAKASNKIRGASFNTSPSRHPKPVQHCAMQDNRTVAHEASPTSCASAEGPGKTLAGPINKVYAPSA